MSLVQWVYKWIITLEDTKINKHAWYLPGDKENKCIPILEGISRFKAHFKLFMNLVL